ncbi:rhodanese-like domain-containing protein [Paracoccaceae bacterium GXU_MW_L88]
MTISQKTAAETMELLGQTPDAQLVDVRSRAEFAFVGVPDLSGIDRQVVLLPIRDYPDMQPDPQFADLLDSRLPEGSGTVCFICRSGARSMEAARLFAAQHPEATVVNVSDGFEGDLDWQGHRGNVNGWKQSGLPWRQS